MANYPVKFVQLTEVQFKALAAKDKGTLYFLSDLGQIYKGDVLYSGTVMTKTGEAGKQGVLYVDANNRLFEGTGNGFKEIVPAAHTLDAKDDVKSPTSKAVDDYLKTKLVADVAYDSVAQKLSITKYGEAAADLTLTGMLSATGVSYVDGTLTLPTVNGEAVVLNLPKENFVKSGSYDAATQSIVLVLTQPDEEGQDQKVIIPVSALVDISKVEGSATLDLKMSAEKVISGAVKISAAEGNLIVAKDDGIFVSPVDVSGKLDAVDKTKVDEIVTVKADGQVKPSGKKVGGATLAAEVNSNTVATEAAVKAADTALETKVEKSLTDGLALKVAKADIAVAAGTTADASDEKVASQKALATVKEDAAAALDTKAKELTKSITDLQNSAAEAYVEKANISTAIPADAKTAVDTKVASEKAVADVKTTLEAADAALLEAVQNVSNSKVDKASILAAVSKAPSDEKVLSEKAVDALIKAVKQEISEGLSWDDQTVV